MAEAYLRTWIPLVWRKLEVPARSDFEEPQTVPTNHSPWDSRCQLMRSDESEILNLILAFPMLEIINVASPADIEVLARLNQHVICGDYEGDRGMFWVISCDPDCDWDIIGSIPEGYW